MVKKMANSRPVWSYLITIVIASIYGVITDTIYVHNTESSKYDAPHGLSVSQKPHRRSVWVISVHYQYKSIAG